MKNKMLLPAVGIWLTTLAAAYYMGSSQTSSEVNIEKSVASDRTDNAQSRASILSGSQSSINNDSPRSSSAMRSSVSGSGSTASAPIKNINQLSDPLERSRQMLSLIDSLSPDEFESTVADFRALGMTSERMSEYSMLLHAWGKVNPLKAISYVQTNSKSDYAVKEVLASWAMNDATSALTWARENHEGDDANPYLTGIIRGLAGSNPTLATQVLQELPYSEERGEALRSLAPHIASLGLDGAQQWLSGIKDPKLVSGASAYLASQFSKQNPTTAADWVNRIEDDDARTRALTEVVDNWTDQDPSAAKSWIATLPYDDQLKAGPEFVNSYARQDANAAADWLDQNSSAPNYQELLRKFADGARRSDPLLALNYGNELEDENSRSRSVGRALWTLYRKDKTEARNWIQNNDVPERVRRHVNKMMDN